MENYQDRAPLSLPFDLTEICSLVNQLIPEEFIQSRSKDIKYLIDTKWKKGVLTKISVDDEDITRTIVKSNIQDKLEKIMRMSKDFKPFFTGTTKMNVHKENGKIISLYVSKGHYAISRRKTDWGTNRHHGVAASTNNK